MLSDSFAGIAPASVPGFVVAQLIGGAVALGLIAVLYPGLSAEEAAEIMQPQDQAAA
jgi:arsenate reductase